MSQPEDDVELLSDLMEWFAGDVYANEAVATLHFSAYYLAINFDELNEHFPRLTPQGPSLLGLQVAPADPAGSPS